MSNDATAFIHHHNGVNCYHKFMIIFPSLFRVFDVNIEIGTKS